jgi:hypothetical protein
MSKKFVLVVVLITVFNVIKINVPNVNKVFILILIYVNHVTVNVLHVKMILSV